MSHDAPRGQDERMEHGAEQPRWQLSLLRDSKATRDTLRWNNHVSLTSSPPSSSRFDSHTLLRSTCLFFEQNKRGEFPQQRRRRRGGISLWGWKCRWHDSSCLFNISQATDFLTNATQVRHISPTTPCSYVHGVVGDCLQRVVWAVASKVYLGSYRFSLFDNKVIAAILLWNLCMASLVVQDNSKCFTRHQGTL